MPTKCAVTSEPEDEHLCIAVHPINNNICDTNPLENSSNIEQKTEHCLTQHGGSTGISKLKTRDPNNEGFQNKKEDRESH